MTTLDQKIKKLLDRPANLNDCEDYADAFRAVLDLRPPALEPGEDPDDHELLDSGWWTCRGVFVDTIASILGITQETPNG